MLLIVMSNGEILRKNQVDPEIEINGNSPGLSCALSSGEWFYFGEIEG